MFPKVDELREKLKKAYPGLNEHYEKPKRFPVKSLSVEPGLVRPTITFNEIANMLQQSSKHKKIKDTEYGPLPKRQTPFKVKVQEYEIETSLDCFMKHIATKSFERCVVEKTPGFRKVAVTEVRLPERKKKKKIVKEKKMNFENLEVFGQVEVKNKTPNIGEKNLKLLEKGIQRNVKNWCLQEKRKNNTESQLIDYRTFKRKNR